MNDSFLHIPVLALLAIAAYTFTLCYILICYMISKVKKAYLEGYQKGMDDAIKTLMDDEQECKAVR